VSRATLHAELAAEGGLVADALVPRPPDGVDGHAAHAASGPRAAADPDGYALVVTAIREGYLLHYDAPAVVVTPDPDLALLAGDRLYAFGLDRLAALGDLPAVAALAEVIALCAQARAAGDADLAEAVWEAGAAAVGWGDDPALAAARDRARKGDPSAASALRSAARQVAESH
jgi:hypothetical protein